MSNRINIAKGEINQLRQQLATLQAANGKLRKCVELYADKDNWVRDIWMASHGGHEPAQECLQELEGGDV